MTGRGRRGNPSNRSRAPRVARGGIQRRRSRGRPRGSGRLSRNLNSRDERITSPPAEPSQAQEQEEQPNPHSPELPELPQPPKQAEQQDPSPPRTPEQEELDRVVAEVTRLPILLTSPKIARHTFRPLDSGESGSSPPPLEDLSSPAGGDDFIEDRAGSFAMNVIIQPTQARPDTVINPPLVVCVSKLRDDASENNTVSLFAVVSVQAEDGTTLGSNFLGGEYTDSLHVFDAEGDGKEVGFAAFPNLRFTHAGRFQLRVSLMRNMINSNGRAMVTVLQRSDPSGVINVDPQAQTPPLGKLRPPAD